EVHRPKSKLQSQNSESGSLHPVQREMVACHGSQCGYCTPGFIVSMFEGYYRDDIRTNDQLDDQLCGNLCRCTGYRSIRLAAVNAWSRKHRKNGDDPFARSLESAADLLQADYGCDHERFYRPTTVLELLKVLAR